MEVFIRIFRTVLSLLALVAVVRLGIKEAETGQNLNIRVYAILGGVVFGLSGDDIMKVIETRKSKKL